MPKTIAIEGFGNVEFPDSMDDAAISHAIETEILSQRGVAKNVPGTVANKASARLSLADQTSRPIRPYEPVGPDTPGFWKSAADTTGIPTDLSSAKQHVVHTTRNILLPPGTGQLYDLTSGMLNARTPEEMNRVANPLARPMEQIGEKNWSGLAGTLAPYALTAVIGLRGKPGTGGSSPNAVRLPLPDTWEGPEPSGSMPVHGGEPISTPARLPLRLAEYGVREMAGKIPAIGTYLADKLKGTIARPKMTTPEIGQMDLSEPAAYGDAPQQGGSKTNAFAKPRHVPIASELPDVWTGEEPQSIGNLDLEQPAVYGDAPNQGGSPTSAFARPRTVGSEFEPRGTGGKFSPRKSIPLKGDVPVQKPAPTSAPTARIPVSAPTTKSPVGFGPSPETATSPSPTSTFNEGDAVTLPGNKVATVLDSNPDFTTVRTGKVTARLPTARLRLGAEAVEPAAPIASTRNPAQTPAARQVSPASPAATPSAPSTVGKAGSRPSKNVEWTDRTGSRLSGTVVTKLKSKSGPAFIVRDSSGKSRFVHADKLA